MNDEDVEIQRKFCSNSRVSSGSDSPTRMGQRLLRNIDEAYPFFKELGAGHPILDAGCGDGLGIQHFQSFGDICQIYGIEFVPARVEVAQRHGLSVFEGSIENTTSILLSNYIMMDRFNVFCSHTLEHCADQGLAIRQLQHIAHMIWILVPIEPKGSGNKAHLSPVRSLDQIECYFPASEWKVIRKECRYNLEPEGCIGFVRISRSA